MQPWPSTLLTQLKTANNEREENEVGDWRDTICFLAASFSPPWYRWNDCYKKSRKSRRNLTTFCVYCFAGGFMNNNQEEVKDSILILKTGLGLAPQIFEICDYSIHQFLQKDLCRSGDRLCEDLEPLKFMPLASVTWHLKRMPIFRLPSLASVFARFSRVNRKPSCHLVTLQTIWPCRDFFPAEKRSQHTVFPYHNYFL